MITHIERNASPVRLLETTHTAVGHRTCNIYGAKRQRVGVQYKGVGGAAYVRDAYGNAMGYRDAEWNMVAEYVYDAFGRTAAQNGTMADVFTIRYSTKYYDADAFCGNGAIVKCDPLGLSGWLFSAVQYRKEEIDYSPGMRVLVSYEMNTSERKCCDSVVVLRYVRMRRGNGGLMGDYVLDQTEDQSWIDADHPHTGTAPLDNPEGPGGFYLPGIGLYRREWRWDFLFKAKCKSGRNSGKILSTAQKYYYAEGHWDGNDFIGHFYEK